MRGKTTLLAEALTGFFTAHHGELLAMMLANIDRLTEQITVLGADHHETRINAERRARNLASALQAVTGQKIIIRGGKAIIIEAEAA